MPTGDVLSRMIDDRSPNNRANSRAKGTRREGNHTFCAPQPFTPRLAIESSACNRSVQASCGNAKVHTGSQSFQPLVPFEFPKHIVERRADRLVDRPPIAVLPTPARLAGPDMLLCDRSPLKTWKAFYHVTSHHRCIVHGHFHRSLSIRSHRCCAISSNGIRNSRTSSPASVASPDDSQSILPLRVSQS